MIDRLQTFAAALTLAASAYLLEHIAGDLDRLPD